MKRFASGVAAPLVLALLAACGSSPGGTGGRATSSTTTTSTGGQGTGGTGGTGGVTSTASTGGTGGTASTGGSGGTGGASDADAGDAGNGCSVGCTPGECMVVSDCAALGGHSSTPGYCPGASDIQCCTAGGSVSDNPPIPTGWMPMMQSQVTSEMTSWAVSILNDPTDYPMFSSAMMMFGSQLVMARVEWHPPDFQNCAIHRGVTLYEPG